MYVPPCIFLHIFDSHLHAVLRTYTHELHVRIAPPEGISILISFDLR